MLCGFLEIGEFSGRKWGKWMEERRGEKSGGETRGGEEGSGEERRWEENISQNVLGMDDGNRKNVRENE